MSLPRNTLVNIIGSLIPMVVMLISVPMYLGLIGDARYGVLSLVWLMLGYLSFLDMGLGKATANQIAKTNESQLADRNEIVWSAICINGGLGLIGAAAIWSTGEVALRAFLDADSALHREIISSLPWIAATFPLVLVSSVLTGAIEGRSQFVLLNVLQTVSSTAFQLVPLFAAQFWSPTLDVLIPSAVVTRALMNTLFAIACTKIVPVSELAAFSFSRAKRLFNYGGWVAITGVLGPMLETAERFIIGAVLGAASVAAFAVPMQLVGKLKVMPSALARAMFPRLSAETSSSSLTLVLQATKMTASVMMILAAIVAILVGPFLSWWLNPTFSATATPIALILLVGVWFTGVGHLPYFYLQARGRPDLVAKLHAVELPVYLVLTVLLVKEFGLIGASVAWTLRCAFEATVLLLIAGMLSEMSRYLIVSAACLICVVALVLGGP
jgi:O-antigen/teichoic acid export membrane protein